MTVRVVLVDDHAMFRAGVRGELGGRVDVNGAEIETLDENAARTVFAEAVADGIGAAPSC